MTRCCPHCGEPGGSWAEDWEDEREWEPEQLELAFPAPPPGPPLSLDAVSRGFRDFYLAELQEALTRRSVFLDLLERPISPLWPLAHVELVLTGESQAEREQGSTFTVPLATSRNMGHYYTTLPASLAETEETRL
jgi:hypothetical protein